MSRLLAAWTEKVCWRGMRPASADRTRECNDSRQPRQFFQGHSSRINDLSSFGECKAIRQPGISTGSSYALHAPRGGRGRG
jgi:hypothetical protein